MTRILAPVLACMLLLTLAACVAGEGSSGPYVGGSLGGNVRTPSRDR
ncbi:hypothetical protein [Roseicella sp. DB1501]|nr:hypothetical protein [Roseicella sp. DB1501]NOG69187.1 hypothetical protein [Roseicella sp. DB1501]